MNAAVQVDDLQSALVSRARALADEYVQKAGRDREKIAKEAAERLAQREEREEQAARSAAERLYRQKVQASEIRLREEIDKLRWVHVQTVKEDLKQRMEGLVGDEPAYRKLLVKLLANAATAIESEELLVLLNGRDAEMLTASWDVFVNEAAPGKQVRLSNSRADCSGGLIVIDRDNRIRVDNSFEGRLDRLESEIEQVIMERLFASATPMGALFNG